LYRSSPSTKTPTPTKNDVLKLVPPGIYGRGSERTYMERGTAGKGEIREK
jgi:hypothetical protein